MTRKLKPVEIPIGEPFRAAMLSVAVPDGDGFTTVGTLVQEAQEALLRANAALGSNSLVSLAAQSMMKEHRRRGGATVEVGADGSVLLRISYNANHQDPHTTIAPGGAGLPSLSDLRQEAHSLGVGIAEVAALGRQKRKIMERIEEAKGPTLDGGPARLRDEVKTSPPLHSEKLPPR